MAMQTSGGITLAQIQTEHGGSNPISLSEYYKDASYANLDGTGVPAISPNNNIPTSGAIHFSNFHGSEGTTIINVSGTHNNYNLRTVLTNSYGWNGSTPIAVHLVIASGAILRATSTSTYGLSAHLHPSSILSIQNSGIIVGKGGAGGAGGIVNTNRIGGAGAAAGHAIYLYSIGGVVLRNYGNIRGGGGGGGGGGMGTNHGGYNDYDDEGGPECSGQTSATGSVGQTGSGEGGPSGGSAGVPAGLAGAGGGYGAAGGTGGAGRAVASSGNCAGSQINGAGGGGGAAGKAIYRPGMTNLSIAATGTINGATS